jgi:hypothetical protein
MNLVISTSAIVSLMDLDEYSYHAWVLNLKRKSSIYALLFDNSRGSEHVWIVKVFVQSRFCIGDCS